MANEFKDDIILYIIGLGFVLITLVTILKFISPKVIPYILKVTSAYRSFSGITMVWAIVLVTNTSICFLIDRAFYSNRNDNVVLYIGITATAITLTTFGNPLIKLWHRLQERPENSELSLKIMNQSKIRYLIFLVYFFLLIATTTYSLNSGHQLSSGTVGFDKVVFQSFATYIAFDRLQSNWKTIE